MCISKIRTELKNATEINCHPSVSNGYDEFIMANDDLCNTKYISKQDARYKNLPICANCKEYGNLRTSSSASAPAIGFSSIIFILLRLITWLYWWRIGLKRFWLCILCFFQFFTLNLSNFYNMLICLSGWIEKIGFYQNAYQNGSKNMSIFRWYFIVYLKLVFKNSTFLW